MPYTGSGIGTLASLAVDVYGMWQRKKEMDAIQDGYNQQVAADKQLAAEQLAITYNSVMAAAVEAGYSAKRKIFQTKASAETQRGNIAAKAAQIGATGRRATLAQEQIVDIPESRQLTSIHMDIGRAEDDLIAQAHMQSRATVNRLISSMPDVPNTDLSGDYLTSIRNMLSSITEWRARNQTEKQAIIGGGQDGYTRNYNG